MKIIENTISLFYPRLCAACGDALQQNETCICLDCMLHLPETQFYKEHNNPLRALFDGRVKVEEVAALLAYKKSNRVQKILHNFKYRGQKEIGSILGEYFGAQLAEEVRFRNTDFIIPIPLHKKKKRTRGYNQSEWIAKGLAKAMNKEYFTDVLLREKFTETQTKKGRFSRWQNVKEVFKVGNIDKIAGSHIIICDDVLTTGATMEAAIRTVQQSCDVKISVVTLAAAVT